MTSVLRALQSAIEKSHQDGLRGARRVEWVRSTDMTHGLRSAELISTNLQLHGHVRAVVGRAWTPELLWSSVLSFRSGIPVHDLVAASFPEILWGTLADAFESFDANTIEVTHGVVADDAPCIVDTMTFTTPEAEAVALGIRLHMDRGWLVGPGVEPHAPWR